MMIDDDQNVDDSDDDDDELQARRVVRGVLDVLQAGHGGWPDETRSEVARHGALIRRCFHEASSADDVLQRLSDELVGLVDNSNRNDDDTAGDNSGSIEWVKRTMDGLKKCSPMSLQLTYEQLRRGASMDLKQCLTMVRPVTLSDRGDDDDDDDDDIINMTYHHHRHHPSAGVRHHDALHTRT